MKLGTAATIGALALGAGDCVDPLNLHVHFG